MSEKNLQNNHLSIEFGGGFSFLASYNRSERSLHSARILAPAPGDKDCLNALRADELFISGSTQASLSFCNGKFVMMPNALFAPEHARAMLQLNASINDDDEVRNMDLPAFDAQLIYAASREVEREMTKRYPRYHEGHCAGHFLSLCRRQLKDGQQVFLYFYPGFFLMSAFNGEQLQMINAYSWRDPDDVLYFSLYACEQIRFDPVHVRFSAGGEIEKEGKVHRLLERYTTGIQFMESPGILSNESSRFLTLSEQFRCA